MQDPRKTPEKGETRPSWMTRRDDNQGKEVIIMSMTLSLLGC